MDPSPLHPSLLRPPLLHILRAAGFTTTRPSVLDTLTDLTIRHLNLLCASLARHSQLRQPPPPGQPPNEITLLDVRMALQETGAFYPSVSDMEEQARGYEDTRGVDAFIAWSTGEVNREIRRIAGMDSLASDLSIPATSTGNPPPIDTNAQPPDKEPTPEPPPQSYLTALKRKHAKTRDGEEARYAGTILGRDREESEVRIEGWEIGNLNEWGERMRKRNDVPKEEVEVSEMEVEGEEERGASETSSPLSEISGEVGV